MIVPLWIAFSAQAMFAQHPMGKSETDKWREDLAFMAQEMPRWHKNLFHTVGREQFENAVRSLNERIPSLARHQIVVELARIVALVGDGHTNIAPTRDPAIGFRTFPIKLYFFKDGLYVRAATTQYADVVGARVSKIGSDSIDKAYSAVREIIGRDNEMDVRFFAPHLLVMPEVLHALGLIAEPERAQFTVERDGQSRVVELKPFGPAEMMAPETDVSWLPKAGWVDARDTSRSPLWLKDPQNKFWFTYLPDSRTVYVQFNQVGNKTDETIERFARRLFAFVEAQTVDRFVLDLRLNRGGNGEFNRPLLLGIIKSKIDQRGKLFAIIGRSTWSAAQFLTNDLEKYTNTIFVGEPSGGKVNSYGDSRRIILPNHGITVRVSSLWWQQDERDNRPWTSPQIAADLTIDDYRNNRDPALLAVLHYVPRRGLGELITAALETNDPKTWTRTYLDWRTDPVNAYVDPEPQLFRLGHQLLVSKRTDQPVGVLHLCVDQIPASATCYAILGDAYLNLGKIELARQKYEKALKLNPRLFSVFEALNKIQKQPE